MANEGEQLDAVKHGYEPMELTTHVVPGAVVFDRVFVVDAFTTGPGGASHHYRIEPSVAGAFEPIDIRFQKGGAAEVGINGMTVEALLAIVRDRLEGFAAGPFPSPQGKAALSFVTAAMEMLAQRTRDRVARQVEGLQKP
jgi:hypothetical protein